MPCRSHLRHRSGVSRLGFPIKILYAFLYSPVRVTFPALLIQPDFITTVTFFQRVHVMKFHIVRLSANTCYYLLTPYTHSSRYFPFFAIYRHCQLLRLLQTDKCMVNHNRFIILTPVLCISIISDLTNKCTTLIYYINYLIT